MAPLHIGGGSGQQIQAARQPVGDHRRGGRAHPAGGQLDRQRHASDQATDATHGLIGGRPEGWPEQAGVVLEQLDRIAASGLQVGVGWRVGQAGHLDQALALQAQAPP